MPRTVQIQIRVSPEEKERILRVAKAVYLDPSAWMRSVVLRAVDTWEAERDD